MTSELTQELLTQLQVGGNAYVRNLAGAEAAVRAGQFNLAKVLRAASHAQRAMAMEAGRLLNAARPLPGLVGANLQELKTGRVAPPEPGLDPPPPERVEAAQRRREQVSARLEDILQRAAASLAHNSDVLESDVAQILWGCYSCGCLIEGDLPDACPVCGALSIEFEPFEPFYSSTAEHLGHTSPEEMIQTLAAVPSEVEALLKGADEAALGRNPSEEEWSPKEIVGHIIEVEALFNRRVHFILEDQSGVDLGPPVPPWKLHEGKGYEAMTGDELVRRLTESRQATLKYLSSLSRDQWVSARGFPGGERNVMDLGAWLTNHDVGHVAQIRRYLPARK